MARKLRLKKWDSAAHPETEADIARYWEACLEEGRDAPAVITSALGSITHARGMSQLARKTGLTRDGLYNALSQGGNPELGTVMKVIRALGLEIRVRPRRGSGPRDLRQRIFDEPASGGPGRSGPRASRSR